MHDGSTGTVIGLVPEERFGIVVLTNPSEIGGVVLSGRGVEFSWQSGRPSSDPVATALRLCKKSAVDDQGGSGDVATGLAGQEQGGAD